MTAVLLLLAGALVGIATGLAIARVHPRPHPHARRPATTRRILLPFTTTTLSCRALEAALRLAQAEEATLMPAFLATVPLTLSLDSALPRQSTIGLPLLEVIEQRAAAAGVPVDARVQSGRSYRHALARILDTERFDRVILSAADDPRTGLSGPDLLWLLDHTDGEVMILRPARAGGNRTAGVTAPNWPSRSVGQA